MNCKICFENYDKINHKPIILLPCAHSFCSFCASQLQNCSTCRQIITGRKPNYDLIENLDFILNFELRHSVIKDLKEVDDLNFEISLLNDQVINEARTKISTAKNTLLDQMEKYKKMLTEIDLIRVKYIPESYGQDLMTQSKDVNLLGLTNLKAYKDEIKTEKLKLESKINQIRQISIAQIDFEIANVFLTPIKPNKVIINFV